MARASKVCSVARLIEEAANSHEQRTALLGLGRAPLTHGDLSRMIGSVAERLSDHGIRNEDRVALVIENGPEAATAFLSISCTATCAPLNPSYRREEWACR